MKKRILLTSFLTIALCFSLLTAATFALFTSEDTVNIAISSGNVEYVASVEELTLFSPTLLDTKGNVLDDANAATDTVFANGGTAELNGKVLTLTNMTPGDEVSFKVVITNNSTITTKYQVVLSSVEDAGLVKGLAVTIDGINYSGGVVESDWATLEANAAVKEVLVSVKLPTTAGNEYKKLTSKLAVTVSAVQGNVYQPPVTRVSSEAELNEAIKDAEIGESIILNSGEYVLKEELTTDGSLVIEAGADVTLNLNGQSLTTGTSVSDDPLKVNKPTVYNSGNLTIEGGAISNGNATAGNTNVSAIHNVSGNLTIKNCTLNNVAPTTQGNYCVTVEGGSVTLIDCAVVGSRGGIAVSKEGSIHMVGGTVSATVYYPLYITGTGNSTFENVTFTKNNSSRGKAITYNVLEESGSATFTNCIFVSKTSAKINLDINKNYTGFTLIDCQYDKVNAPAA